MLTGIVGAGICGPAATAAHAIQARLPARPFACGTPLATDAAADREIRASYASYRQRYVTAEGAPGALRVRMPGYGKDNSSSESIGYGMLLAAHLGDRATLDGLWAYARRFRNPRGLMAWEVSPAGRVLDANSATDGDQDIAYALLVADARWGGYRADALALLRALLRHNVEGGSDLLKPGDVWGGSRYLNASYFAPAFYKVFAAQSGDARWLRVADASYRVLDNVDRRRARGTGLFPAWTTAAGDSVTVGGRGVEYSYDYGAARIPWRLATDAAWTCDARALRHLGRTNAFFRRIGPRNVVDGYTLVGRPRGESHLAVFVAPLATAAMFSTDAGYRRALWAETVRLRDDAYYGDSLRLLSLLLASGRMTPPPAPVPARR